MSKTEEEIKKERDTEAKKVTDELKKETAKNMAGSTVKGAVNNMSRNAAIHGIRKIPIIGGIFDVTRSASYIPGVEEGARKIGDKITKTPKGEGGNNMKKNDKAKKGLIIGIIAGVVVIVGVVLACVFLLGGNYPKDFAGVRQAFKDKKAINCEITEEGEENGSMIIQANDGWTKFKMIAKGEGVEAKTWMIEGDATYSLMGSMAVKTDFSRSDIDDFMGEFSSDDEEEEGNPEGVTVSCSSPSKNDFTIPNEDWMDMAGYED